MCGQGMRMPTRQAMASFLVLLCFGLFSQNKIQSDVEVRQLAGNKVVTLRKHVCYSIDGKCVTHFDTPQEMYIISNSLGESYTYWPSTNTVWMRTDEALSSKNEILYVFSSSDRYDLGLSGLGFSLAGQERDSTRIVRTFRPERTGGKIGKIIMVYENDLPIYCGYFDTHDRERKKIYYSDYTDLPRFSFPATITEITVNESDDTIIRRQVYKNIKYDSEADSPVFDFRVPDSAKVKK